MGIEKMSLVSVEGSADMLDKALMLCCESHMYQIKDYSSRVGTPLHNLAEHNPYSGIYSKVRDMAVSLNISGEVGGFGDIELDSAADFRKWYEETGGEFTRLNSEYEDIKASVEEHRMTLSNVKHLRGLHVSFPDLFGMKYIKLRIGRMPLENIQKLDYYADRTIYFMPFEQNEEYVWGIYVAPVDKIEFADLVMGSLFFERTRLPDYLEGDVEDTDKILEQIIADEEKLLSELEKELAYFSENHRGDILAVMSKLKYKSDCFELRKKALISGERFSFSGYCPTKHANVLAEQLGALPGVRTVEIPLKGGSAAGDVPTKLKNNAFFRPFEMFVTMYGLPRYGGFDPTPYVAVTYMLMFGIMFGDLGQGLVVSLLGLILSKFTKNGLAPIMTRIGICSAAFGVLYGSVFGIETIITPFFHREDIWRFLGYTEQPENIFQVATTLLIAALGIGIVLILISMIFNTILNFKKRNFGEALFSVNGIAGLVFYTSLVAALVDMFMLGIDLFSPAYIICLIVLPLVLIFFKHPLSDLVMGVKHSEKTTVGNFIIENFIELFEAALSYLSNTMSFLRIGGFILSHAGMMLVVAQLAGTNDPSAEITVGTVITYIIGNAIVMGVEGLLVGIQVLRLEFYEIFNRFYDGSGTVFRPLEIQFDTEGNL